MTTTAIEPTCPECGGQLWDNRLTKKNPKAPDWKCRDKACSGVIWPPKNGARPAPAAAPANVKQPLSAGPHIPAIDGEHPALPHEKRDMLFGLYTACFHHAYGLAKETWGNDTSDTAVAAMAATLFIQAAEKAGVFQ